ncbi:cytochrome o ubiquinol oxidase subunit III [Wigglesworthia glossinidia endosymbiont of Glossina morsitans morsitans (Yale colony)]|uniref:Cytochrome bo(3) ubiquinol oxidase subunit 3 n=1 Tax=Wigglesworthia glossinidia endosymbiont of Glossina morsitans morsitans (Yale colony) TaxID=1142511 RepID=H6Q5G4_WIGGL|nr:cytochrome o ubiquinol oxidase subunit III [Wigglesworthia glossinidia]AFA41447.1 cytochrome o ubiquinol oxidase subunit III [Wigglesworthia glossinidia endosymbiont of Glossina morsitans morsitans (Yale colony)]
MLINSFCCSKTQNEHNPLHCEEHSQRIKILGFWVYLMSDCILFATLFATYFVLKNNIAGGPSGKDIFEINMVFLETIILLSSSITCGIASLSIPNKNWINFWLFITVLLGIFFVALELQEFYQLIHHNYGPEKSAFLSIFFTLVGTHGIHVVSGILWMIILIMQTYRNGYTIIYKTRLKLLSLFWHFLDVIWIFVFNIVYLLGVII